MIDWWAIVFHSFWLVGAAALLAGLSYHYWLAGEHDRPVSQQLNQESFRAIAWFSLLLIGIGLAGTSQAFWEILLWVIVSLYCGFQLVQILGRRSET